MPGLRRIGAIGDIHAQDRALECVLSFLAAQSLDRILAVGDIVDGPGDSGRCCQLLESAQVQAVRGNHDRWALAGQLRSLPDALRSDALDPAQRRYLDSLPAIREYTTVAGRLLLCHGLGTDDMNRLNPDDHGYALDANRQLQELLATQTYRYVVHGHTHRRMVRHFDNLTIINAGTLVRDQAPCFAIIDFQARCAEFYELPADGAIGAPTQ